MLELTFLPLSTGEPHLRLEEVLGRRVGGDLRAELRGAIAAEQKKSKKGRKGPAEISCAAFEAFAKKHKAVMKPAKELQDVLKQRIMGAEFWVCFLNSTSAPMILSPLHPSLSLSLSLPPSLPPSLSLSLSISLSTCIHLPHLQAKFKKMRKKVLAKVDAKNARTFSSIGGSNSARVVVGSPLRKSKKRAPFIKRLAKDKVRKTESTGAEERVEAMRKLRREKKRAKQEWQKAREK